MNEQSVNYRYVSEHIGSLFERELRSEDFSEEVIEHLVTLLKNHISDLEASNGQKDAVPLISRLVTSANDEISGSKEEAGDAD